MKQFTLCDGFVYTPEVPVLPSCLSRFDSLLGNDLDAIGFCEAKL